MRLADLIAGLDVVSTSGELDTEISELAYDSRRAAPGALLFCFPGERADGHDFAARGVANGAVALVVERPLALGVPEVVVADARAAMAPIAARLNGDPTAELTVAAVTGTNGKTTTAFLLREVLRQGGIATGLLGTVKQVVGGADEPVVRTTPEAIDLQATFARMLAAGDTACVMEASSHALALHRCDAIHLDAAVFTNLSQDHLDFHRDMEDYFEAKRLLFEMGPRAAIVNVDDAYGRRLARDIDCMTYSAEGREADFTASAASFDAAGARFLATTPQGEVEVETRLPGHFNIANALAALAAAVALGLDPARAAAGLARAARVPGRFEPVEEGQPFSVLVDYAHTPDSLKNVLRAARRLTGGNLIVVFGAGGDRDRKKRPLMGAAAAELSDRAIVTSDNPRSEDPEAIVAEILAGIGDRGGVEVEIDRRQAIATAIRLARPGDTVVVAGKGHEQGQEFEAGRKLPFDDREVARQAVREAVSSR